MPSVSKKQHNFMAAVANNPKFAKKVGVPRSVGEEFLTADKGKKFRDGGMALKPVDRDENPGLSKLPEGVRNKMGYMKKGGMSKESKVMVKKEVEFMKKKGAPKSMIKHEAAEMGAMKKGGMSHSDISKDKPMMKKVAAKAVKGHEKRMHGMAKGGGVEVKGKTKGKMIKMNMGGKAC
jgi:hypothetical protein